MEKYFLNNKMFNNLVRLWLSGFLLFIPFQHMISRSTKLWSEELSIFTQRLDEITVVIFLPLTIIKLYKDREILNRFYLILLFPIFVLSISGFISGIINGNPLFITILGIFDYIKIFLFIFIYASYFKEFSDFKKIFHLLLIVAVFLGVVAVIQEFWALGSIYVLGTDILDSETYLFHKIPLALHHYNIRDHWRFGMYRAPSLVGDPNFLGFYCLLILTIYIFFVRKVNFAIVSALMSGIFLSISRKVYSGFVILAGVQIFRGMKWFIALIILPISILLFSMSSLSEFDLTKGQKERGNVTYREYTRHKAIEIWKDHPFWGVGPGKFGGVVSVMYQSPVYEEYNFSKWAKRLLKQWKSIDQFWPQVLAEMGIIGTIIFAGFFITLFITFFMLRQWVATEEMRGLFIGLAIFTIIILIWSSAGSIKNPVIYTYSALVGMVLGASIKKSK